MIPIPIRVHAMQPAVLFASPATSKLGASTAGPAGPYRQRRSKNPLTTDQWRAPGHTPTAHTSMEIGSGVRLPDRSHPSSARGGGAHRWLAATATAACQGGDAVGSGTPA